MKEFRIFASAALGKGLSGGDRIFIEFARRLCKSYCVTIHVWNEGYEMCKRQGLYVSKDLRFKILDLGIWCKFGFVICYFARIIVSVIEALKLSFSHKSDIIDYKSTVIYSASEFWMDCLPAFILKLRFPEVKWIAAWFQTAPNPLTGFSKGNRDKVYRLSAFYHWFMQLPIKPIIANFADLVLVNNELERKQFSKLDKIGRTMVVLGAVNIKEIERYQSQNKNLPKIYDAVFQGRFHPQKGVVELVNIWKLVTEHLPNAKLAMIGDGPLMKDVKLQIIRHGLQKNIKLFGWVFDGPEKYRIFAQSKLVVHPAFYDSGGMAAAEAMAFGLPCVGFNLPSYKSYYPRGMVKVKIGNVESFAQMIVDLLNYKGKRDAIGSQGREMIQQQWSWDQRVNNLLKKMAVFEKI